MFALSVNEIIFKIVGYFNGARMSIIIIWHKKNPNKPIKNGGLLGFIH